MKVHKHTHTHTHTPMERKRKRERDRWIERHIDRETVIRMSDRQYPSNVQRKRKSLESNRAVIHKISKRVI